MVYAAKVDGRRLTFEVLGIWRKNMVIRDRETRSLWQQVTGEAIDGPLKGKQLDVLFAQQMNWGAVRANHPHAWFALALEKYTGLVPQPLFKRLLHFSRLPKLPGRSPRDKRLDPHALVVGVLVNAEAKAYPMLILRSEQVIHDQVGGEAIVLDYDTQSDFVSAHDGSGNPLRCERQWWLSWSEFHPRCAIYQSQDVH